MIGIAGGSGSGKTTFARYLTERLGVDQVTLLAQDNYYIDQSHVFDRDGGKVNFDHPDSIDWPLLEEHLKELRRGRVIEMPIYDFVTHKRSVNTVPVAPKEFVILDGILIYVQKGIRDLIDHKLFIHAREDVRFTRRLKRDTIERGRTAEGVKAQYFSQVKPMHDQFVEPTMRFADHVISGETDFSAEVTRVFTLLTQNQGM